MSEMTAIQETVLRSLISELADKHDDNRLRASARHLTLPGPLLAAAIAATYADHWAIERAFTYFVDLGFSQAQIEHAFTLLVPHALDICDWYQTWQPSFN